MWPSVFTASLLVFGFSFSKSSKIEAILAEASLGCRSIILVAADLILVDDGASGTNR